MKSRDLPAMGVSLIAHVLVLGALYLFKLTVIDPTVQLDLETVFEPERTQEEFTKELEIQTEVAQTFNTQPGGAVTGEIGASTGPVVTTNKVEQAETLEDPQVEVSLTEVTLPSDEIVGKDFGEGEVTGESGAAVEGYGAAMSRMTNELIRMMRKDKLLAVWLFDESGSMKDDQKEIARNFNEVYEEIGILTKKDEELKKRQSEELILTSILSFGETIHQHNKPTSDIEEIRNAIGQIPIDTSGKENMCNSINATIDEFVGQARQQRRRLVLIIVSDESGDDGDNAQLLETTVSKLKQGRIPAYFMGRESMFGYPYARVRWVDPKYNLPHWLQVRRGPETPMVECLQWDGLHSRWDTQPAGFGPYAQVRMARESGGIFFILPGEEEDLVNARQIEKRKYEFLDMKEYQPFLGARREYIEARDREDFRRVIFDVIERLNPYIHKELSIREHWYPMSIPEFQSEASKQVPKAVKSMGLIEQALAMLDKIRPLRDTEPSMRWRANYDLAYAQLVTFRIRLFQFLLAMDKHVATNPEPKRKDPKTPSNAWNLTRVKKMIVPDQEQYDRLKGAFNLKMTREEYLADLEVKEKEARNLLEQVAKTHPNTPWAGRAKYELSVGFGMTFVDVHRSPNYDKPVQLPNL
ncbi:MAG: VWA domain-containing protein [Planctomycetaceae bacterium]|nr:VWA domain-containing protein [Planctomycetaceae bacterium]